MPMPEMTPVDSSNIAAVGYEDAPADKLWIEFQSGGVYSYDAPKEQYEALLAAGSPGAYFHQNIRNVYSYQREA